ncbi:MAG: hypothetical protein R2748_06180 [Bryobacterales bacterium]
MDDAAFGALAQAFREGGAERGFARLAERWLAEKNYPALFETRLMAARVAAGLPAILNGPPEDLDPEQRAKYEQAQIAAARETGELFLRDGQIYRAWPYFRAVGDPAPVRQAIAQAKPSPEEVDGLVEIAFHEGVDPKRGFELILEHYGTCRAITNFNHFPSPEGREESALLLTRTLYADLLANLKRAVESVEGSEPQTDSIAELIEGRDWLFEGNAYYLDTSHVSSIVQMSVNLENEQTLRMALDLTEYGKRLGEMYQFRGEPPFENVYEDCGVWLRAMLGEDSDAAVEHFRAKIEPEQDPYGDPPAQALVRLLVRLGRYDEAVEVARERLADLDPQRLSCPTLYELCLLAEKPARLAELAKGRGDLIAYAAALAEGAAA